MQTMFKRQFKVFLGIISTLKSVLKDGADVRGSPSADGGTVSIYGDEEAAGRKSCLYSKGVKQPQRAESVQIFNPAALTDDSAHCLRK